MIKGEIKMRDIPKQEYVCRISPEEFEYHCLNILRDYAEKEQLKNFCITHNEKIAAYDGTYQIDVYATFVAMGVKFKVIW